MELKKVGKALLFPPAAVLIVLTPIAAAGLVYSMLRLEGTDPIRIGSYILSFYTLTTFPGETMTPEKIRLFLGLSGGAVSIFIIAMAVCMIVQANRKLKSLEEAQWNTTTASK